MTELGHKQLLFGPGRVNRRSVASALVAAAVAIGTVAKLTTPYMATATVAYVALLTGVLMRSKRKIHVPLMVAGVMLDFALVLILQFKRSAIQTAIGGTLTPLQQTHIAFSSTALALYVPAMVLGAKALSGAADPHKRPPHAYLGRLAFFFRTCGFILMFSMLEHVKKGGA